MTSTIAFLVIVCFAGNEVYAFSTTPKPRSTFSTLECTKGQQEAAKDLSTPLDVKLAGGFINLLFSIKPLWKYASGKARASMVERGARIGVDWVENVGQFEKEIDKLSAIYDSVRISDLIYPDYYLKPFHAYDEGNLSWQVLTYIWNTF
jgi:hypothetical protein